LFVTFHDLNGDRDVIYTDESAGAPVATPTLGTPLYSHRLLEAEDIKINANTVWHSGNLNLSTIPFAASVITTSADASINGLTVGRGGGNINTNVAFGLTALSLNTVNGGNVAIGVEALMKSTVGSLTAVGGYALKNNTTGTGNVAVGYATLLTNTTGYYNTAVGYDALRLNTTGANNTALGHKALYTNQTGVNNVAIGSYAMENSTGNNAGVAIGMEALRFNTTGGVLTAVGNWALTNNTTGNYNTAIGYQASQANTTAIQNTSLGYAALKDNVAGGYNVAIGSGALISSTGVSNSTAVGFEALRVDTGGNNVAMGWRAAYSNTTGSVNTYLGGQVAYDATTGQRNTFVGYNTGRGVTTGSYNTIIGANVTGLSPTLNQTIILADGAGNIRFKSDTTATDITNNVILSTTGTYYRAFNEDSRRVKFATWYGSDTDQAGFGQMYVESFIASINVSAARRIGFYLNTPTGGTSGVLATGGELYLKTDRAEFARNLEVAQATTTGQITIAKDTAWGDPVLRKVVGSTNYLGLGFSNGTSATTNVLDAVVITRLGNVGINTTTPTSKLTVKGTGTTSATKSVSVENSSGTEVFSVKDNGETKADGGIVVGNFKMEFNSITNSLEFNFIA
jgi:hypothetical protein